MRNDLTVHVIDDEEAFRRSLTFLLASAGFAVRAHDSAAAFLQLLPLPSPACLVTDLRMPDIDGVELLKRLRKMDVEIPSIVITGVGDVAMAVRAMKAGAVDFIEKPFRDEVLISAINDASAIDFGNRRSPNDTAMRLSKLTDREHQVLEGIINGLQNKMIAFRLGISARTVEVHRANMMDKMGAHSLAELIRMVLSCDDIAKDRKNT